MFAKNLLVDDFAGARFVVALVHVSGASSIIVNSPVHRTGGFLGVATLFFVIGVRADFAVHSLEHEPSVLVVDVVETKDFAVAAAVRTSRLLWWEIGWKSSE